MKPFLAAVPQLLRRSLNQSLAHLTRRQRKALAVAPPLPVIDRADRISRLPEEIQAQILSFLPAHGAVRTCVLARTWCHVWKFTRRLLLRVHLDGLEVVCLDASEIRFEPVEPEEDMSNNLSDEDMSTINSWIHSVLECQMQILRINIDTLGCYEGCLQMRNVPILDSRHLTRLELTGIWFDRCLNLDGCRALEDLEIIDCDMFRVRKIMSLSLKRLVIRSCNSYEDQKRFQICVPRLVSLWLDANNNFRTPLLERMPELVGAKVLINSHMDFCSCEDPMACYHITQAGDIEDIVTDSDEDEEGSTDYAGQNSTKCVVLEGLAQARDLLLVDDRTYILRRDLRWCPTFSKLKTLVLIEKYMREPADCSVLECMLEHAPLLEKLTLILKKVPRDGKYRVEIKGYPDTKVTSTKISQHLQIVEIISEGVNGTFFNVLNLLDTLNICFKTRVTKYMP